MRTFLCALAAGLVLVLGGCGSGNGGGRAAGPAGPMRAAGPEAVRPDAGGQAKKAQNVRLAPRSIIFTADLTVRSGDVPGAASRAKQIVAAAGGYVGGEESVNSPGAPPSATLTFKIPSDRYPQVLDRLGSAQVGERTALHQQADDVTQDVADVASRVASAKATLASFRSLLAKATSVNDIVAIEQEIAQRETDLESLEARQRSLAAQTTYATVTLRLQGLKAEKAGNAARHRHGFTGGLAAGWRAFTGFTGAVAVVAGWLLPFTPLFALVAVAVLGYRRWRRTRTGAPARPATAFAGGAPRPGGTASGPVRPEHREDAPDGPADPGR